MLTIEIIGWIATAFFAISALPQSIKSVIDGHSKGMSLLTLLFWYFGEVLMLWYTLVKYPNDLILIINYVGNIILLSVILKYKFFPRNNIQLIIEQTHCENDVVCYTVVKGDNFKK